MSRKSASARKPLPAFGRGGYLGTRGRSQVRAYLTAHRGVPVVRVQWSEKDPRAPKDEQPERHQRQWDDTPENRTAARVFGQAVHERLERLASGLPPVQLPPARPKTVREVWAAYSTTSAGARARSTSTGGTSSS
jgi:hypothetical protein